jgi:hypothetical protein
MDFRTNVRAILESHFSGFQEEIIDSATDRICEISKDDISCKKLKRNVWEFYCSYCNAPLKRFDNYCSQCGRKIAEDKEVAF